MIARVAIPALGRGGDRLLDYLVPQELSARVRVGSVVRVPVREREARGLVAALSDAPEAGLDPAHLRPLRRLERQAAPEELVVLVPWLADVALAGLGAAALPILPPPAADPAPMLVWAGPLGERPSAAERRVAELLADGPATRAELVALGASVSALGRLRRIGKVVQAPERPEAAALASEPAAPRSGFELTPEQAAAAAAVSSSLGSGGGGFLLVGPTGSGKTEVYLDAIASALTSGRGAIVLVPEIALTPQTVSRFRRRFGDAVAVLHSAQGQGERAQGWRRLARGEARVAVGPRSAVWAPVSDLGVIVVDEEPESSYRGDQSPRYDARTVALERARRAGAAVVMGSATPSLEALWATEQGAMRRLDLGSRAGGRPMPSVEVVDLTRERARPAGSGGLVTTALADALAETTARGEQAVLLLNRRGYHPVCLCRDCGHTLRCSHCDVSLTLHVDRGLLCHYCGRASAMPAVCPNCRGTRLGGLGAGTQRLEEEVRRLVPQARVARLDRDVVRRRGASEEILGSFARGDADILIGTQMVAKGHDLGGVTLVGVVLADQGLRYPDMRAAERTAQLLVQAVGRAGRGERAGRAVLQTYDPDHAAVRAAVSHDYLTFAREEMARRREFGYPPFGALTLATVSGVREDRVEEAAGRIAALGRTVSGARVLGPAPPPVPRMDGRFRRQVMLRLDSATEARDAGRVLLGASLGSSVRLDVVVDPG